MLMPKKDLVYLWVHLSIWLGGFAFIGYTLWHVLPFWWLSLIAFPVWYYGWSMLVHHQIPRLTTPLIERLYKSPRP